jgi:hypothetical protein
MTSVKEKIDYFNNLSKQQIVQLFHKCVPVKSGKESVEKHASTCNYISHNEESILLHKCGNECDQKQHCDELLILEDCVIIKDNTEIILDSGNFSALEEPTLVDNSVLLKRDHEFIIICENEGDNVACREESVAIYDCVSIKSEGDSSTDTVNTWDESSSQNELFLVDRDISTNMNTKNPTTCDYFEWIDAEKKKVRC